MPKGHYGRDMSQSSSSRDLNKFIVRLPDGMRERIAEEAKRNNRSMNAEVVHRLEQSLSGDVDGVFRIHISDSAMDYIKRFNSSLPISEAVSNFLEGRVDYELLQETIEDDSKIQFDAIDELSDFVNYNKKKLDLLMDQFEARMRKVLKDQIE